ncbi:MAG: type II secretion system protein [Polyangiales bacterium]
MQRTRVRAGFTLVELMIAIGIIGMLCAVAIPALASMVKRSKTAEVTANLNAMFKQAASYYAAERSAQGQSSGVVGHCTVEDAGPSPATPGKEKQSFEADTSYRALGFHIADQVYFSYAIASGNGGLGRCGSAPNTAGLYTFHAHGDLDGNNARSTFELAAGSNESNVLYHAVSFHIDHETE